MEVKKNESQSLPTAEVASCLVCARIFYRPHYSLLERMSSVLDSQVTDGAYFTEQVRLRPGELEASAQKGCDWCDAQLLDIQNRHGNSNLSDPPLSVELSWRYTSANIGEDDSPPDFTLDLYRYHRPLNQICVIHSLRTLSSADDEFKLKDPRDFPASTLSDTSKALVLRWLENCKVNHGECQNRSEDWLPTRLIDVSNTPKLVATQDISKNPAPPYITLSHRWGAPASKIFRLLSSNQAELMTELPLHQLSQVFLDAISFTRHLGIRYIWIDSLCIIQDSTKDWKAEAALMWKVYTLCTLNIAADPVTPSQKGLSYERTLSHARTLSTYRRTFVRKEFSLEYLLSLPSNVGIDAMVPKKQSLQRRAWVLQERVLSPRTIHFSDQVFWECRHGRASEAVPERYPWARDGFNFKRAITLSETDAFAMWDSLVFKYINCAITFSSDRFVALGAIAKIFEERCGSRYCAGMWRKKMPNCLLWYFRCHDFRCDTSPSRQAGYGCPTWSWLSLDWSKCRSLRLTTALEGSPLVKIDDIKIVSPFGNHHAEINSAEIFLTGRLGLCKSRSSKDFPEYLESVYFDTGRDSAMEIDIFLLPITSRTSIRGKPKWIYGLLLTNRGNDPLRFERVGLYDFEMSGCPAELMWAVRMVEAEDVMDNLPDQIILV